MNALPPVGAVLLCLIATVWARGEPVTVDALAGFTPAGARMEREKEEVFDDAVDPGEIRGWLEQMTSAPNQAGSLHDGANAEFILGKFREWGWTARVETASVLCPTPKRAMAELLEPGRFRYRAKLWEPPLSGDRTSREASIGLPPFAAYGADGDVTGPLIYVNFGLPSDYRELAARGIDAQGAIVLVRNGRGAWGVKARIAREHGAVACLLFCDPMDGGSWCGDPYPKGAFRPDSGVPRGSAENLSLKPGDPGTRDGDALPGIPVLPLGSADARPFLASLAGPVAPPAWRGALPVTYHLGPGPSRARVLVVSDWTRKALRSVVAVLPGTDAASQWVIRTNPRDAWVFGARDPLAGCASMLAEAKAIGVLVGQGWRPRRTLVYAAWDGEAPGLLGSVAWAAAHEDELRRKGVLIVDSAAGGRGCLRMRGSPLFAGLAAEAADSVADPDTGASLRRRMTGRWLVEGLEPGARPAAGERLRVAEAGGGPELEDPVGDCGGEAIEEHDGIAVLHLGFDGPVAGGDGMAHSSYDSFDHFTRFVDPSCAYEAALARTAGRIVLRCANAAVLPVRCADLAGAVDRYVDEVRHLAAERRTRGAAVDALVEGGDFRLAAGLNGVGAAGANPSPGPALEAAVPDLDFGPLVLAAGRLRRSAAACDAAVGRALADGEPGLAAASGVLQGLGPALTDGRGLGGRPWMRNLVFAPSWDEGDTASTLPAVRDAIEQDRWGDVDRAIRMTAEALGACADRMDRAAALLGPGSGQ